MTLDADERAGLDIYRARRAAREAERAARAAAWGANPPRNHRAVAEWIVHGHTDEASVERAFKTVDRRYSPVILNAVEPFLDDDVLTVMLPSTWGAASLPLLVVPARRWAHMFARTGYIRDGRATGSGVPAVRPAEPLVLYRGATYAHRHGWSWTEEREVAELYAAGRMGRQPGAVWQATVEPSLLLARIDGAGDAEHIVRGDLLRTVRDAETGID